MADKRQHKLLAGRLVIVHAMYGCYDAHSFVWPCICKPSAMERQVSCHSCRLRYVRVLHVNSDQPDRPYQEQLVLWCDRLTLACSSEGLGNAKHVLQLLCETNTVQCSRTQHLFPSDSVTKHAKLWWSMLWQSNDDRLADQAFPTHSTFQPAQSTALKAAHFFLLAY